MVTNYYLYIKKMRLGTDLMKMTNLLLSPLTIYQKSKSNQLPLEKCYISCKQNFSIFSFSLIYLPSSLILSFLYESVSFFSSMLYMHICFTYSLSMYLSSLTIYLINLSVFCKVSTRQPVKRTVLLLLMLVDSKNLEFGQV